MPQVEEQNSLFFEVKGLIDNCKQKVAAAINSELIMLYWRVGDLIKRLRRLVAIDLKLGHFEAGYKAQMQLYLNWLNKYERQEGEQTPIGLILCEH